MRNRIETIARRAALTEVGRIRRYHAEYLESNADDLEYLGDDSLYEWIEYGLIEGERNTLTPIWYTLSEMEDFDSFYKGIDAVIERVVTHTKG